MADLDAIRADLEAEHADLDSLVEPLPAALWATPTPAEGWTVADQIAHLAYFDERAAVAIRDPQAFAAALVEVAADPAALIEGHLAAGRAMPPRALLAEWRARRTELLEASRSLDPATRVPWYGPPMGAASFLSARLMETWCHGQDVADALGIERVPAARLRHVAHLGVRARGWSYVSHGLSQPAADVRVELTGPDGETWTWGPEEAPDRVRGSALDFCLVVTQRRHLDDVDLEVRGEPAAEWMAIAQAFAGPPGPGRAPGQFRRRATA